MFFANYKNRSGAETNYDLDRASSMIVGIGKGKSETLSRLALQDISEKRSLVFVGRADTILSRIPPNEANRVLYINPTIAPFALNVLDGVPLPLHPQFASTITNALIKEGITPYREYTFRTYFRYALQTLLQIPNTNLISITRFLTDSDYRTELLKDVENPVLKYFWDNYDTLPPKERRLDIDSTLSLLYDFMLNPDVAYCLFQETNKLTLSDRIVLIDVKDNPQLVSLILAYIALEDVETTVYVDDAEPYKLALLELLETEIPVVFTLKRLDSELWGAVKQVAALRTSVADAHKLEPEMYISEGQVSLTELEDFTAYVTMSRHAEIVSLPPLDYPTTKSSKRITSNSALSQNTESRATIKRKLVQFFTVPEKN